MGFRCMGAFMCSPGTEEEEAVPSCPEEWFPAQCTFRIFCASLEPSRTKRVAMMMGSRHSCAGLLEQVVASFRDCEGSLSGQGP